MQDNLNEFERRGVKIAAISPDTPSESNEHARKQGYSFVFLSDHDAQVIRRYDLLHHQGRRDLSRPAEFLIDPDGVVRWVNLTGDYRVRATAEEVLAVVDGNQPRR